ncbi:cleft lip and palate transmembrane protein 1-like [Quillaja saponaria]|uniref:Cleft lip and palate transmembrane protein 1-like n=1 Tax=Quillaja saponaria TaxID=32244 RepID=A0AAD7PIS3_QUISA|nr:cleft lip and palate transmembrane protein 1-like [Quillaja saponaria]
MAPPDEVAERGQGPQRRQQQGGFGLTGIIRMAVFWYFASKFFSPKKPTEQGVLMSNIFQKGEPLDMWLYLSEHEKFNEFGNEGALIWHETNIPYAVWGPESTRSLSLKYHPSEAMKHNGSLYVHVFFARSGYPPDPNDPEYQPTAAFGKAHLSSFHWFSAIVTYLPKSKADKRKSLLGKSQDSSEGETVSEMVDDVQNDSKDNVPVDWVAYWKPNITINLVDDFTRYPRNGVPPNIATYLNIDPSIGNYYPIVFFNEFWLLRNKLIPINETVTELPLNLEVGPISSTKWQLFLQIDQSFQIHRNYGSMLEGEADELKRVFLEGNPYLLAITMVVSLLHSVFDFLAFKNDIQFWNKNKSMEGLSAKTVVVSFICQLVVFLYLLDNDTSWMILASSGIGCCIEFWKIGKAMRIEIDRTGRDTYVERHRSWYSWILSSLTSCVYMFGFIMMCPQLFINYKLKSVAHLPWRQMTYKFLNTIIDDLFAFVIKMPTLHRLSVFRDDLIFVIYVYQRWIYPVDKKRVNEFGFGGEDDQVTDGADGTAAKEDEKKTN